MSESEVKALEWYSCTTCGTSKTKIVGGCITQMLCHPFWDRHGLQHFHDENNGVRTIECEKGHVTVQPYNPRCMCGWAKRDE
jgi:hypothetical protein